jgi:hypothetical protein
VWLESYEADIQHFFLEQKIVGKEIGKQTYKRITSSASRIPEGLQGHQRLEHRIKKIHYSQNACPYLMVYPMHGLRK